MSWSYILAGAGGVVAVIVASLIVGGAKSNRGAFLVLAALLFFGFNYASRNYILPQVQKKDLRSEFEQVLDNNRLFSLLGSQHPEFRERFIATMLKIARETRSKDEAFARAMAWGNQNLAPYLLKYPAKSSDEALYNFALYFGEMLSVLNRRNDEACVSWMFGGRQSGPAHAEAIRESVAELGEERMFDVMADIVESAIESPVQFQDQSDGNAMLVKFVKQVAEQEGEDFVYGLSMMDRVNVPGTDKRALCSSAEILYRELVQLPDDERSLVLRTVFSG